MHAIEYKTNEDKDTMRKGEMKRNEMKIDMFVCVFGEKKML